MQTKKSIAINKKKGAVTSPPPTLINKEKHPELIKGVHIQYISQDGATRSEVIDRRDYNTLFVKDTLGKRSRITIDKVIGYWPNRVAPTPKNLVRLKDKKDLVQRLLEVM
jgi:hypothetical protein